MPARKRLSLSADTSALKPSELPATAIATVAKMAATGWGEKAIARRLGVDYKTWMKLRESEPLLGDALQQGRDQEHHELFSVLFNKAKKGDSIAAMFLLKARHGYREGEQYGAPQVQNNYFQLPKYSPEEAAAIIELRRQRALAGTAGAVDAEIVGGDEE